MMIDRVVLVIVLFVPRCPSIVDTIPFLVTGYYLVYFSTPPSLTTLFLGPTCIGVLMAMVGVHFPFHLQTFSVHRIMSILSRTRTVRLTQL